MQHSPVAVNSGEHDEKRDAGDRDAAGPLPGYWPSAWPVECGGNRRQKAVRGPGLALAPAPLASGAR